MGEPLSIDPGEQRLLRCGQLSRILVDQGHEVVFWSTTVRHVARTKRAESTVTVRADDGIRYWLLNSRLYRRNVSLDRILSNRDVAREFARVARTEPKPDIVYSSYPTPEISLASARYAQAAGVPSVVDVRDLWPDIWPVILPKPLRPLGEVAALPFYWQSRKTFQATTSICGITDDSIDWALKRAGRRRNGWERVFPLAYPVPDYNPTQIESARAFWSKHLDHLPPAKITICVFMSLNQRRLVPKINLVVAALRLLPPHLQPLVRFVVCGDGETLEELRQYASGMPQVVFPGWVNGAQIHVLASSSQLGLLPYPSDVDLSKLLPNKVGEYLAYGLPILSSLTGPTSRILEANDCGLVYERADAQRLAEIIAELLADENRLKIMSDNARATFVKSFAAPVVYGQFAEFLADLAKDGKRSAKLTVAQS